MALEIFFLDLIIPVFFENSYSGAYFELDDEKIEIVSRSADAQA